jgi:hypothetical protein
MCIKQSTNIRMIEQFVEGYSYNIYSVSADG